LIFSQLAGHGVRDSQAMIATLRQRLLRVPARLVHHAGAPILRSHRATSCSTKCLPASARCQHRPHQAHPAPNTVRNHATRGGARVLGLLDHRNRQNKITPPQAKIIHLLIADSGLISAFTPGRTEHARLVKRSMIATEAFGLAYSTLVRALSSLALLARPGAAKDVEILVLVLRLRCCGEATSCQDVVVRPCSPRRAE
jgi:hypothetical protein